MLNWCASTRKSAAVQTQGMHITGVRGERHVKMKAVAQIEQLSGSKDIVLVVTKAYDMPDAAEEGIAVS